MSTAPSIPPLDATRSVVREYISYILHDYHDVPEREAQKLTEQWRYGRGSELRTYDIDTFRSIFGGEAGALLFAYVQKELDTSRADSSKRLDDGGAVQRVERDIFGMTPGLSIVYLMLGLTIIFGFSSWSKMDTASNVKIQVLGSIGAFSFVGFMFSYLTYYFPPVRTRLKRNIPRTILEEVDESLEIYDSAMWASAWDILNCFDILRRLHTFCVQYGFWENFRKQFQFKLNVGQSTCTFSLIFDNHTYCTRV